MRFFNTLFFLFTVSFLSAQTGAANRVGENTDRGPSLAKIEKKALESRQEGDEYQAMQYYARILSVDSNNINALRGYAETAYEHAAYGLSGQAYRRLNSINPNDYATQLRLADLEFRQGNYEEAIELFNTFLVNQSGKNADQIKTAEQGRDNCKYALDRMANAASGREAILLDTTINTEYSEYMNFPMDNGDFYFSSYRFPFKKDKGDRHRERRMVKIMSATLSGTSYKAEVLPINEDDKHTLHTTFNREGNIMFYAEGTFINSAEIRCDLFMRKKEGNNVWGPPVKLPEPINMAGFTTTEPSVGAFKNQGEEMLFFVSDRPGGKGGRDIWYSLILPNGALTQPANLTQLNTVADDVTPFYHSPTGTLYFSKAEQPNLGGFDVYAAVGQGIEWGAIVPLAPPINSSANDVFYTLSPDAHTAFFSSNRYGSASVSEEACCYDIFEVPMVKPQMMAYTFNKLTRDSLERTNLRLFELKDGKWMPVDSVFNIPGHYYPFAVNPGGKYRILAGKNGFQPDTIDFETPRLVWPGVMRKDLFLNPMKVDLIATVFDKRTNEPLPGTTARFVDLGPVGSLTKDSGQGKVNNNDKGNDYYYPLEFDHRYKVFISKGGYTTDSTYVTTEGLKETTTLKAVLKLQRGVDLEALVFDNTTRRPVPLAGAKFELYEVPRNTDPNRLASEVRPIDHKFFNSLDFGKRYRIIASKAGFSSDTLDFNVSDLTTKPFETIKKELMLFSLDLENYLPIRLYFDNDRPDVRTTKTTTTTLYSDAYFKYFPKKDTFIQVYTQKLYGTEKDAAIKEINMFFEDSLRGEFNRLRFFTEVLFEKLKHGDSVIITLKGFASPRAATNYNKNLTARRIVSVENFFRDFDGALLKKFIGTGQLIINEEPNGEIRSRKGVNDNINDPRNSVFSPSASKERRVEIIGIQLNNKNYF